MPKLTVLLSEAERRAAKIRAAEQGVTVSDVVRRLLALWLAGKVKV